MTSISVGKQWGALKVLGSGKPHDEMDNLIGSPTGYNHSNCRKEGMKGVREQGAGKAGLWE